MSGIRRVLYILHTHRYARGSQKPSKDSSHRYGGLEPHDSTCGRATDFMSLLLARIAGAGEAGASPPSHSLISDYFPVEARATALSIYALGIPIGSMIGNFVGGWGAEALGWRNTFYLRAFPAYWSP